jgi:nucleoside-diphosphate-sugar epimerase
VSLDTHSKIVISGGAGLVGQNLVIALQSQGCENLLVLDKSTNNLNILRQLQPAVTAIEADLSVPGSWQAAVADADVLVILHAQIGGLHEQAFERNNIQATRNLLDCVADNRGCYLVHVSSSVVNSAADDFYTRSKAAQEQLVREAPQSWLVLRPTLMFGWFDRKHFGWLSRFMSRVPVFPVPGDGNYLRQPLFAGDFCRILLACIEQRQSGECLNISGKEKVAYIDIIRQIRSAVGSRAWLVKIPVAGFRVLLWVYALFDRNPPFTTTQLQALVIDELFEDTDWESRFGLQATPLAEALEITFQHPRYSHVVLDF